MRSEIYTTRSVVHGGLNRSLVLVLFLLTTVLFGASAAQADEPLFARLDTDLGSILLVFYPELAPHHVDNFVHLARTGFYDGTKFHRIVPGFVMMLEPPDHTPALSAGTSAAQSRRRRLAPAG